jgi:hypothetical protein
VRYRLWCVFRGWQWPLREGEYIEVRSLTLNVVAQIPMELVEALIAHHLDGLALQTFAAQITAPPPPRKPLTKVTNPVYDAARRKALREQRKKRSR